MRQTDISFPARVPVRQVHNLRVQLIPTEEITETGELREIPRPHAHDIPMALAVPSGAESIQVAVSVTAENFVIEGNPNAELIVPSTGKSTAVTFLLRGQNVGPGRVMIDFTQDRRPIGSVDLNPEVIPEGESESSELAQATGQVDVQPGAGPVPDIILKVFEHRLDGPGRLQFVLSSFHPDLRDLPVLDGDMGVRDLRTDLAGWVDGQLAALTALAERPGTTSAEVEHVLRDVGRCLYETLLPERFRRLYWTLRDRKPHSLLVLSDEPHIPWELVRPFERDAASDAIVREEGFWGETFALTRWLRGRPPSRSVALDRFVAVTAASGPASTRQFTPARPLASAPARPAPLPLPGALQEIERLRSMRRGAFVLLPSSATRLRAMLEQGGFDVLHLACHGTYDSSVDRSKVLLEDGEFSVAMLPHLSAEFRRASPLVFFNACHSGRLGFTLLGPGSWGAKLIHLGCGAFVGSLWPVRDTAAAAFAEEFYRRLATGESLGEAMRQSREHIRRRFPGDPTWLAYCCFADPLARQTRHQ